MVDIHPAALQLLRWFSYHHLPPPLQDTVRPFEALAGDLALNPKLQGPELTTCLRKLLEAKDCAVRATIAAGE